MTIKTITAIIMLFLVFDSGYFMYRYDFWHVILVYSSVFALYFYVLKRQKNNDEIGYWLRLSVILRGVLLFSVPRLSEDIYRFIWDGRLILLGINPFNYKPSYFIEQQLYSDVLTPTLYAQLNSPDYFSVYPSVCQAIFALAVAIFPKSTYGSIIIIKLFIFITEIGTLFLIKKMLPDTQKALIYALNPLIIIELCGNAHFEALMIFFLMLGIYVLHYTFENDILSIKTLLKSSLALAFSIASKLLPFILLPFFMIRLGMKRGLIYATLMVIWVVLLFLPLFNPVFISNMQSSLNLYFNKFEFNASLYYILREIGISIRGYNPINEIALLLKIILLSGFVGIWITDLIKNQKQNEEPDFSFLSIFQPLLFTLSLYFLCANTVHPWYSALPLAVSVFTPYRYIVLWTSLLPFTYIHYAYAQPTENYLIIAIEYTLVIVYMLYEILFHKRVFVKTKRQI